MVVFALVSRTASIQIANRIPIHTFSIQISSKDILEDRKALVNKFLTITQVAGVTGYVWKVDGQFRTVTDTLPLDEEGNSLSEGVQYKIENFAGRTWMGNCVGTLPSTSMIHG